MITIGLIACGDDGLGVVADAMVDVAETLRDAQNDAVAMDASRVDTREAADGAPVDGDSSLLAPVTGECSHEQIHTQVTRRNGEIVSTQETTYHFAELTVEPNGVYVAMACDRELINYLPCPASSGTTTYECSGEIPWAGDIGCLGVAVRLTGSTLAVDCGQVSVFRDSSGSITYRSGVRFSSVRVSEL